MDNNQFETHIFEKTNGDSEKIRKGITTVFHALEDKGYDPIDQIIGYILSGDPTYITSHLDARSIIQSIERDELLSELLTFYLQED